MNDKASLVKAMQGAFAVFAVTNYWEKMDMQLEIDQGKRLADAAKETGVQHYIWSSLLNVTKCKSFRFVSFSLSLSLPYATCADHHHQSPTASSPTSTTLTPRHS